MEGEHESGENSGGGGGGVCRGGGKGKLVARRWAVEKRELVANYKAPGFISLLCFIPPPPSCKFPLSPLLIPARARSGF